jgi:hypothetical protein
VRFVRTLKQDLSAVEAAVSERWSNGPVEGQLNRLKMLKRQMYGRAGIELLRARLLPEPAFSAPFGYSHQTACKGEAPMFDAFISLKSRLGAGRTERSAGRYPGMIEEALLAIQEAKALFLAVGRFLPDWGSGQALRNAANY